MLPSDGEVRLKVPLSFQIQPGKEDKWAEEIPEAKKWREEAPINADVESIQKFLSMIFLLLCYSDKTDYICPFNKKI